MQKRIRLMNNYATSSAWESRRSVQEHVRSQIREFWAPCASYWQSANCTLLCLINNRNTLRNGLFCTAIQPVSCHDMVCFMVWYGPYCSAKKAVLHAGGVRTTLRRTACGYGKAFFVSHTMPLDVCSFSILRIFFVKIFYFQSCIFIHFPGQSGSFVWMSRRAGIRCGKAVAGLSGGPKKSPDCLTTVRTWLSNN